MKRILTISLVLPAVTVLAATRTWQGGQFADWTNTANWVEGKTPTKADTIYIGSDLQEDLLINMRGVSTGDSNKTIHDLRITGGTVVFTNGSPRLASKMTNVIDVAENAKLKIHCTVIGYSYQRCWIWKTGKGLLQASPYASGWNFGGTSKNDAAYEICVKEGTLTSPGAYIRALKYVVSPGATLGINAISTFSGWEKIHVEKGGLVNLNSDPASKLAGLSGGGDVVLSWSDGSYNTMALSLFEGPYCFSGSISGTPIGSISFYNYKPNATYPATDAERDFVIGGARTLANFKAFYATITPSFAADVGEYWTAPIKGTAGVPIVTEDVNGAPIRLHAVFDAATPIDICGSGDWFARNDSVVTGRQVTVTGLVGSDSGTTLTFDNDADVSSFAGVVANGSVDYKSVLGARQDAPLLGTGSVTVDGPTDLRDVRLTGSGSLLVNAKTTVAGGEIGRYQVKIGADAELVVDGSATRLQGAGKTADLKGNAYPVRKAQGVVILANNGNADSYLTVTNGARVRFSQGSNSYIPSFSLVDGGAMEFLWTTGWHSSGKESVAVATLDGGSILLSGDHGAYGFSFPDSADADTWLMRVGAKGATIGYPSVRDAWVSESFTWKDYLAAESGVTDGKDGGISFAAPGVFNLYRPQNVTGPVRIDDGRFVVTKTAADIATDGRVLGSGDFVLSGGSLAISDAESDLDLKLATAADSKFVIEEAGRVDFGVLSDANYTVRKNAQTVTVGPSGAAASSLERKPGGVLFVTDPAASAVNGTNGKLLVSGGVDCYGDGRTKAPVFTLCHAPGNNGFQPDFAKYDAEKGVVSYDGYADGLAAGEGQVMRLKKSAGTVSIAASETKRVAGLLTFPDVSGNFVPLKIGTGGKLEIGDGTNPASILVGTGGPSDSTLTVVSGGTVDFGSSEGVVAVGERENPVYSMQPVFDTSFSGTAGVTFAGVANNVAAFVTLKRASDYEGGTTIGALSVRVEDGEALGSGEVKVCPGRMGGGQVAFLKPMTMENDFVISGTGMPEAWRDWYAGGALVFKATGDVHLTGNVRIDGFARVSTKRSASAVTEGGGVFDGVISGGQLQVLTGVADGGAPIVLTQPNTYTGGTEVFCSKLVLRGAAPSLGTGDVLMDRSWLRFENTAALTVPNRITGDGTIVLAGTAPVTFAGDVSGFTAVLDLAGTQQTLTEFPSFVTEITNSSVTPARLVLAPNLGTVALGERTLSGKLDLEIGEGTLLDLGGAEVTVRRCYDGAEKRVINGILHETKPLQGALLIVR